MSDQRAPSFGIVFAVLSGLLFGASTPLAKLLLGSVTPYMTAGLLYLGAGIGLLLVQIVRPLLGLPEIEAPLCRQDLPWLGLVILTGGIFGPLLLMLGLQQTTASSASLLLNVESLATMLIAWIIFRENVDRRLLLGAAAILAGAVLLSWQGRAPIHWSALLIVGACICWGIDNNLTRMLSSSDPVQIAMLKGIVAGVFNTTLAFILADRFRTYQPGVMAAIGLVGFFGYGVSLTLFVLSLRHLGTARTGAYFSLAPFVGAILSVPLLHETVSMHLLIAGILMAFGLWMHLTEHHEHEHFHEAAEHHCCPAIFPKILVSFCVPA